MDHKKDIVYLEHMLSCAQRIMKYTNGIDEVSFKEQTILQDAVIRNLEIIGEATKKLSLHFRSHHSHIPWRQIAGMRDKLIHDYLQVDVPTIWQTVQDVIPEFSNSLKEIIAQEND